MKWYETVIEGQRLVQQLGPAWHKASADGKVTVNELADAIATVLRNSPYGTQTIAVVDPNDDTVSKGFAGASIVAGAFAGILSLIKED